MQVLHNLLEGVKEAPRGSFLTAAQLRSVRSEYTHTIAPEFVREMPMFVLEMSRKNFTNTAVLFATLANGLAIAADATPEC
jgi:hypothetical protein